MNYFENDFIQLKVNAPQKLLHTVWLRYVTDDEFREGTSLMMKAITENQIQYWISDTNMHTAIPFTQQQLIVKELSPFILNSTDIKKVAHIVSNDVFDYMAYEDIARRTREMYGATVDFEQFTNYDAALAWIGA